MTGWIGLVTLAALFFYFWTGLRVAQERQKHKIAAPAMTGHPEVERAIRVQANTLEWLPLFLVSLWMFAAAWPQWSWIGALVGVVWIAGRFMYMQGYMEDPGKRSQGFLVQGIAVLVLFLGSLIGVIIGLVNGA